MKMELKMKNRLNIRLKLWNNGELIVDTNKRIKAKIIALAQVNFWQKAYLKVTYDNRRGFYNDGIYNNYKDLKEVLSAFTEKALLDYVLGDKNGK